MNKHFLLQLVSLVYILMSTCIPVTVHADDTPLPPTEVVATSTESVATKSIATSTEPAPSETIPSPVTITLDIETSTGTLYQGPLTVVACPLSPTQTKKTVSGYCAVEQSGVTARWSWYGSSAFVDSLNGTSNDYMRNNYWNWFSDLTFGMTALNEHELHTGESLLITIERMPLRLLITPDTLTTESTTTVSVLQFGFDASFNAVWEPASGSTVLINSEPHTTNEAGTFVYVATSSGTSTFSGSKNGYLPTATRSMTVLAASSPQNTIPAVSSGSGGGSVSHPQDAATRARDFLMQHQRSDGSFQNSMLTDWAAIALTSAHTPTTALATYLRSSPDAFTSATDMERRTLALEALNIDPTSVIRHLLTQFDGTQIGDQGLINDDIFGILVLSHAGYTAKDPIIAETVAHLLQKQSSNGGWENTDLTAAALQALSPLTSLPGVTQALARARTYLASTQQTNGCFGNSFTTSWSSMAITALGESPSTWRSLQGNTPLDCLRSLQANDGGFEEGASEDTRVWATAYALPALTGDTWDSLLHSFTRKQTGMVLGVQDVQAQETVAEATTTPKTIELLPEVLTVPTLLPRITSSNPLVEKKSIRVPTQVLVAAVDAPLEPSVLYDEAPRPNIWSRFMNLIRTVLKILKPAHLIQ